MRKKKNKKALGWWQNLSAGDPKKNIEIFNKNMTYNKAIENNSSETSEPSSEASMAEAIESILKNPETNLEALKALELIEKFKSRTLRYKKWKKHCDGKEGEPFIYYPGITEEEYENIADKLQELPIDNDYIVGYKSDNDYVKYNTDTDDFVVYSYDDNGKKYSISLYKVEAPDNYKDHMIRDRNKAKKEFRELSIGEALKELNI